jgi:hypothetical protein
MREFSRPPWSFFTYWPCCRQKKFKKIVENGGFALINNAIVSSPATPKTSKLAAPKLNAPKSKGATAARKSLPKVSPIALGMEIVAKNEAPAKKRKLQNKNDDDTEDCDVAKNVSESEVEV